MSVRDWLIISLGEQYKLQEKLYEENQERMVSLHKQLKELENTNKLVIEKMKEIAEQIRRERLSE